MSPAVVDLEAYIDASSAVVGISIAEAHRPGVVHFLGLAAEMAEVLEGVDLGDGLELAPVFRPADSRAS